MGLLSLIIKFGADITQFKAGTKEMDSNIDALSKNIGGKLAQAFSVAAITAFIYKIQQSVHEVTLLANQFGLLPTEIEKITKAYRKQDLEFADFANAYRTFTQFREKAIEDLSGKEAGFLRTMGWQEDVIVKQEEFNSYAMMRKIGERAGQLTPAQKTEAYKALGKKAPTQMAALRTIDLQTSALTPEQYKEVESVTRGEKGIVKEVTEGLTQVWANVARLILTGQPTKGTEYGPSNIIGWGPMGPESLQKSLVGEYYKISLDYQKRAAEGIDSIKKTIGE